MGLASYVQLVNAARIHVAPRCDDMMRGQNWIQLQFRGETKPSKHHFMASEQIRRTSLQVTRVFVLARVKNGMY